MTLPHKTIAIALFALTANIGLANAQTAYNIGKAPSPQNIGVSPTPQYQCPSGYQSVKNDTPTGRVIQCYPYQRAPRPVGHLIGQVIGNIIDHAIHNPQKQNPWK